MRQFPQKSLSVRLLLLTSRRCASASISTTAARTSLHIAISTIRWRSGVQRRRAGPSIALPKPPPQLPPLQSLPLLPPTLPVLPLRRQPLWLTTYGHALLLAPRPTRPVLLQAPPPSIAFRPPHYRLPANSPAPPPQQPLPPPPFQIPPSSLLMQPPLLLPVQLPHIGSPMLRPKLQVQLRQPALVEHLTIGRCYLTQRQQPLMLPSQPPRPLLRRRRLRMPSRRRWMLMAFRSLPPLPPQSPLPQLSMGLYAWR